MENRPTRLAGIVAVSVLSSLVSGFVTIQQPGELPSGPSIVERHVAAIGGAAAHKAVQSMHVRGRFEMRDQGISGEFESFTARPDRMLYRVTIPAIGVIEHGFDGQTGWSLSPIAGPELLAGDQLKEVAEDAWFDAPLYESGHIKTVETIERTTFDGRAAFRVRVTLASGRQVIEFFDTDSGLQIGSESTRTTPQGAVPVVDILRDYRRFGSLMQATTFVQRALGFGEQIVTMTSCEYDTVPDATFALPPSIAALIAK